jgi:hypothetical protein
MKHSIKRMTLKDALHVKSAEFWLALGQPMEAVAELQKLTTRAWNYGWPVAVFRCAAREFGATLLRLPRMQMQARR